MCSCCLYLISQQADGHIYTFGGCLKLFCEYFAQIYINRCSFAMIHIPLEWLFSFVCCCRSREAFFYNFYLASEFQGLKPQLPQMLSCTNDTDVLDRGCVCIICVHSIVSIGIKRLMILTS